ncbi:MAG: hypothetical protein HRJ53_13545, partial [Acidobacteria bacterium Pan2503]|nr:hypothetical protein [Candidatus Acidoferrum panamensis]
MAGLKPEETKQVKGMTLRRDPAREGCFKVVHTDTELVEYPGMTDISRRERIHRHMNNETGAIEIAAQCLIDFPEAPWELRLQLARQCWDESRHVAGLHRRLLVPGPGLQGHEVRAHQGAGRAARGA